MSGVCLAYCILNLCKMEVKFRQGMSKGQVHDGNPSVIALVKSHPTHWD
jgi:hypothetical protein